KRVLFNVNGKTKRPIRPTKSWSKNPGDFSPPEDDLGNNEKMVENRADGLLKRLLIAALCSFSSPRSLLISPRSSSKFVIGKSIFYKFLNIFFISSFAIEFSIHCLFILTTTANKK